MMARKSRTKPTSLMKRKLTAFLSASGMPLALIDSKNEYEERQVARRGITFRAVRDPC
jgi:hypothetical protein